MKTGIELIAAGAENNQFRDAKKLMSELDNDTQSELAAWELLRDCRAELTAALAKIEQLETAGIHSCHDNCQRPNCVLRRENKELEDEIKRLKSQLTKDQGCVTISRNGYVQALEQQRDILAEALEAADECLALVEDTGHGCLGENITVARSIAIKALAAVKGEKG